MSSNLQRIVGDTAAEIAARIIVPIYNEGENVRVLYDQLRKDGVNFHSLTFVYDMDSDNSLPFIRGMKEDDSRVHALKNTRGRGVINALAHAFSLAPFGPVIVVMGDNSDKLSLINQMLECWTEGATIVSPSRYMKGGKQFGGGLIKSTLSRLAGISLYVAGFPTSDPTNNFKLYDGAWLRRQQIESLGGFEVALELCYKACREGQLIVQLPTTWYDRTSGESRFQLRKWLPHYLRWYFACLKLLAAARLSGKTFR